VLIEPDALISDFSRAVESLQIESWPCPLRGELLASAAPPAGTAARVRRRVRLRAEPHHNLGGGRRHGAEGWTGSARSSLARSVLAHQAVWPWLGIDHLDATNVKGWMLANLDPAHVYVPESSSLVLAA